MTGGLNLAKGADMIAEGKATTASQIAGSAEINYQGIIQIGL